MDGLEVESCSSSRSSPSLRALNLICSSNYTDLRLSDSPNSSEISTPPSPFNTNPNKGSRPIVNDGNRDEMCWKKRRRYNDTAKRSREKRRVSNTIMKQKLLELSKENSLLRSRLQQQIQQQRQQQQQQQISLLLPTSTSHDTVIVSHAQKNDTIDVIVPTMPSLPVSSITTFGTNLASAARSPSKLPPMFPTHLFAATSLLTAPPPGSATVPLLTPPGTVSATTILAPTDAVSVSATQELPMLQTCTLQAALQQARQNYCSPSGPSFISSGHGAFQPFHNSRDPTSSTQSYSPDSSTTDAVPVDFTVHPSVHTDSSSDSQSFLRRQLLERQSNNDMETEQYSWKDPLTSSSSSSEKIKESGSEEKPRSLLGSLLSSKRTSPLVAQSRTDTHSGLSNTSPKDNDLKTCLSSLAVNLNIGVTASGTSKLSAGATTGTGFGTTAVTETILNKTKSDSSDSTESPTSNNSGTDSVQSQISPARKNSAIVKALRSRPPNKQQYMDRRRRNNEAAKRCRANRRAQFEYRSKKAQQLEAENDELRKEMNCLRQELEQLKALHAAKSTAVMQR